MTSAAHPQRLKVAVVGTGVGQGHIDAYRQLPDLYEVAALCDIDEARGRALADKHGIARLALSLDDLLAEPYDLIDLCTPSGLHFPQTLQVLEAGHNVIVEKPLAASLAEVDAIRAAEPASTGRVFPIFQYRFGHGIAKLHHLKARGLLGRASVATAETHWLRTQEYYDRGPWRGKWASELGGTLATHAIHIHDLLLQVLGPLETVYARADNSVNGNETEDRAILALTFRDGGYATSSVTLAAHPQESRLKFCFEGATAESGLDPYNPGHEPWTFRHPDPDGQAGLDAALAEFEPQPERFVGQFHRIHRTLTQGAPPPVTIDDSRASIELLTAAYWSILTGEAARLPLDPTHPFHDGWTTTMKREFA